MKPYLLVVLSLILPTATPASDQAKRDTKDLIEQAEAKVNIFALPSFELKANVRVNRDGNPLDGSYVLLWNGPTQWREEINFVGYNEIQVGSKGLVSVKRTTDFLPLQIYQLHSSLGFGSLGSGSGLPRGSLIHVGVGPNEKIRKMHDREIGGLRVECAEVIERHRFTREVCIDTSTGAIFRQDPFFDRDLITVGTKVFPRFLSYVQKDKPLAEVEIKELKTPSQFAPSAFDPPPGAVSQPGCMNPTPFSFNRPGTAALSGKGEATPC